MPVSLRYLRLSFLVKTTIFALVAMAMGGALLSSDLNTDSDDTSGINIDAYAALAIATGVLTLVTLPTMIALEIIRPGGPTSMIIVEIIWLSILSVLWLATGADTVQQLQTIDDETDLGAGGICTNAVRLVDDTLNSEVKTACAETKAIAGFAFLDSFLLLIYVITILIVALTRKRKGVWTSSVANLYSASGSGEKVPIPRSYSSYPPSQQNSSYASYPQVGQTSSYASYQVEQHTGTGGSVQTGTVHV
ncbi:hypothetical protein GGX14DRAFT_392137 [Mycena pura]|uniref:MARVEL domain-containing protein n=1 Tax=Mycena pura TaxID=153505 RepID=A0AAD6YJB0_9AGAR|nr:hypothetical protein GGX14DRAFT_392137 [Mycena pura]